VCCAVTSNTHNIWLFLLCEEAQWNYVFTYKRYSKCLSRQNRNWVFSFNMHLHDHWTGQEGTMPRPPDLMSLLSSGAISRIMVTFTLHCCQQQWKFIKHKVRNAAANTYYKKKKKKWIIASVCAVPQREHTLNLPSQWCKVHLRTLCIFF
jgi:hypothetical protein